MDKREALNIYLKVHNECRGHKDCLNCPFIEYYKGIKVCVLSHPDDKEIVKTVEDKLKRISEAPEQKPLGQVENVGSIIFKQNEHTRKLIDEAIMEYRENVRDRFESGRIVTEIVIPKGVERGTLPSSVVKNDNVNHPKHYCKGGLECIQVIKAQLTPQQYEGYLYGNVLKYMWRWPEKNGIEDLRKAAHYLMWLQEEVKHEQGLDRK